jgi:hypothetical protein
VFCSKYLRLTGQSFSLSKQYNVDVKRTITDQGPSLIGIEPIRMILKGRLAVNQGKGKPFVGIHEPRDNTFKYFNT